MRLTPEIEKLAAEFHSVYEAELKRQGVESRHPAEYDKLSEPLKDIDRALARFVLAQTADLTRLARAQGIREAADIAKSWEEFDDSTTWRQLLCEQLTRRIVEAILALLDRDAQEALAAYEMKIHKQGFDAGFEGAERAAFERERKWVAERDEHDRQVRLEEAERWLKYSCSSDDCDHGHENLRIGELRSAAREGQAEASPETLSNNKFVEWPLPKSEEWKDVD